MRTTFSKLISVAALSAFVSTGFAQQANLGADCGCPAVASRSEVNLSTKAILDATHNCYVIQKDVTLFCDTTYILDKKIYVGNGFTLTIKPGTVVKGKYETVMADATALIIERGAKIIADGTESCPIVFTAQNDDLNGSVAHTVRGQWGGVVILGKATNNLTLAKNATTLPKPGLCVSDGVGYVEGFTASNTHNLFGGTDDNDNSGILRYVSIRHSGARLSEGNELNGLSLGSVGRGTTIDNIEVISSDDDGIEFFGGTVNVTHASMLFGNDDMFDYDLGYRGKLQFLFGVDAPGSVANMNDNGFEADNDDQSSNNTPLSTPIICNATLIGNGSSTLAYDETGSAAFMAKENTRGEVYNSIFAGYKYGLALSQARSGDDAYQRWTAGDFKFKNNTFVGIANPLVYVTVTSTKGKDTALFASYKVVASAADLATFSSQSNTQPASIPGFDYAYSLGTSDVLNIVPFPALGSTAACPIAAPYRGAFETGKKPWVSTWSLFAVAGVSSGLVACPTDANGDGTTNATDLLQLLGKFGSSCQ